MHPHPPTHLLPLPSSPRNHNEDLEYVHDLSSTRSTSDLRLDQFPHGYCYRRRWSLQDLGCVIDIYQQETDDKGGKSIAFLLYILLTSHIPSWRRWYNVTTVFVMAIIDTLFWAAALGLTVYSLVQIPPTGIKETLTYILIALVAVVL
jgi:hypothetical protein